MTNRGIFPSENIAFLDSASKISSVNTSGYCQNSIEIFEFGPWQYPTGDTTVCARYVIGQSREGYHWDTEFVIGRDPNTLDFGRKKSSLGQNPELVNWSPACSFVDHAIKHARRCIAIQAKNINLDITTKIKVRITQDKVKYMDIHQIALDPQLVFAIEKSDLQRLALFNGYLSWSEFENGTLDFSIA